MNQLTKDTLETEPRALKSDASNADDTAFTPAVPIKLPYAIETFIS